MVNILLVQNEEKNKYSYKLLGMNGLFSLINDRIHFHRDLSFDDLICLSPEFLRVYLN